jgi:DNA-binding response OmpR family regulator
MFTTNELIWILDGDPKSLALYKSTLGNQYPLRVFDSLDEVTDNMLVPNAVAPQLLIADPEFAEGTLHEAFGTGLNREAGTVSPQVIIVSQRDDLELIRFYLKTGARDYILKPLRTNELLAKVERALAYAANREILIMRNDLDGQTVNDLTFREHQLLTVFLSRPNRTVARQDLHEAIWSKVMVNRKTLDVHLFNLRRKLRPLGYDVICQQQVFSLVKRQV